MKFPATVLVVALCGLASATYVPHPHVDDAVNTASRLETIAKQTGQSIVMSAAVAEQLQGDVPLRNIGTFAIRGQGEQQVFALGTDTDADDWSDTVQ